MLDHMKALQIMFYQIPSHKKEEATIRQIRQELRQKLDFGGRARFQCLLDTQQLLQKELSDEYFAAGFQVGWFIMKELWEAGVIAMEEVPPDGEEDDQDG